MLKTEKRQFGIQSKRAELVIHFALLTHTACAMHEDDE